MALYTYNTFIEHISTPVPTTDSIHVQIYMYSLCTHNRQKGTDIQTDRHTDRKLDKVLHRITGTSPRDEVLVLI